VRPPWRPRKAERVDAPRRFQIRDADVVELGERAAAGVVDGDRGIAELAADRRERALHRGGIADVAGKCAGLGELARQLRAELLAARQERDRVALAIEATCECRAIAGTGADHHADRSFRHAVDCDTINAS